MRSAASSRRVFLALLFPLLLLVSPVHAARLALVIGNADYAIGRLKNPVNDARAVAAKLGALGFAVTKVENLKRDDIGRVIETFTGTIRSGDDVVVYYAGHGVQVRGVNYLPAVDARIQRESDVPLHSLNLNDLLDLLERQASERALDRPLRERSRVPQRHPGFSCCQDAAVRTAAWP